MMVNKMKTMIINTADLITIIKIVMMTMITTMMCIKLLIMHFADGEEKKA